jgi:hypothetical protein
MDKPNCGYCGKIVSQPWGAINRARKKYALIYCDRVCAGFGRRTTKTLEQKKEEKRLYDMEYRATSPTLKARRHDYHRRTYDHASAAEKRQERMPYHVEYCRRPQYKAWKRDYDIHFRAKKQYGEFFESAILLNEIEAEINEMSVDRFERYAANGILNKKQTRRRDYERLNSN